MKSFQHLALTVIIALGLGMLFVWMDGSGQKSNPNNIAEEKYIQAPMSHAPMSCGVADGYSTIVIDSCEYIEAFNKFAHKGNCRFCAEKHRSELKEIIELIKLAKE